MRAFLGVAAAVLLAGCAAPQDTNALYASWEANCAPFHSQATADQWGECMRAQVNAWDAAESRRLATASALLGFGANMTALGQPQSYQGYGAGGGSNCMITPLGRGGTQTVTCY